MNVPDPIPNPDQPLLPAATTPPATPPVDLAQFDQFLRHETYRNTFTVSGSELIEVFHDALSYVSDLHRKPFEEAEKRLRNTDRDGRRGIARTVHAQLAAILRRYDGVLKNSLAPEKYQRILTAIEQAQYIEQRAKERADAVTDTRMRGNVRFVKKIQVAPGRK